MSGWRTRRAARLALVELELVERSVDVSIKRVSGARHDRGTPEARTTRVQFSTRLPGAIGAYRHAFERLDRLGATSTVAATCPRYRQARTHAEAAMTRLDDPHLTIHDALETLDELRTPFGAVLESYREALADLVA
ncbi:hypothetical protein [Demequina sp. NBRC 110056]|uniref:hypothetical protein n=1 Tax=Demequina sp. NBRC 110056 TaxID=1570345 RepID=UPI000A0392A3|nr:hypothetical protein [Demequina sp. NBRC 110056]